MIHCHTHTSYSLWDGYGDVEEYKEYVGDKPFVLTEHNNTFSYIKFRRAGLNVYAGIELSILDNTHHITVLAKTERGFARLNSLATIDKRERDFSVVFDENYRDDLLYLTGCVKTYYNTENRRYEILEYLDKGFDIVVEAVVYPNFEHIFLPAIEFAKKHGLPYVLTNDVHFLKKEHWLYNDIINCINSKRKYNEPDRFRYDTSVFFMNEDEFIEKCSQYGIDRTTVLTSFRNAEQILERVYHDIPHVASIKPAGYSNDFRAYFYANLHRPVEEQYRDRLERELQLIEQKGYGHIFALTHQIVKMIRDMGILTNYGRGSAVASLVAYYLGITHVHPIRYNLTLERFMNEYRDDVPDIDIDVPSSRREEIEGIIFDLYGDNVTRLNTLARFTATTVVSDLARIYDIDYESKTVSALEFASVHKLDKICNALIGKPRHSGTHPAGLCFGENIANTFANIDVEDANYLRLVKLDLLGSGAMDIVQAYKDEDGIDYIQEFSTFRMFDVPLDIKGIGTAGVFQAEGDACSSVVDLLEPKSIHETVHTIALSRAPALSNRAHVAYKHHTASNIMKELLPETNGVVIYQEQVMKILKEVGKFTDEEVEWARRIISKLKREEYERVKQKFVENARYEWTESQISQILHEIENSAEYLFNKAHAVAYAHLTYLFAYLKTIDLPKFVARYINACDIEYRTMRVIAEAKRRGVRVHLPKLTLVEEYREHTGKRAYVKDGEVYLTPLILKFRAKKDVTKLLDEYAEKLLNARKTFDFYPFAIHKEAKDFARRYSYVPLGKGTGTFITLAYVVSLHSNERKCIVTDGYTVDKLHITDARLLEILYNAEKGKHTVILKVSNNSILNAKVYQP